MSIRALNDVASQRDLADGPQQAQRQADSDAEAQKTEAKGYLDVLVAAIPTEPLALYTFLVAGIVSTIDGDDDKLLAMRWWIFGVTAGLMVLWILTSYLRKPGKRRRRLPWPELTAAVLAFGAWGLVMPESPLMAELTGDKRTIWTYIITAAGVAGVALLTGTMKKPVKK